MPEMLVLVPSSCEARRVCHSLTPSINDLPGVVMWHETIVIRYYITPEIYIMQDCEDLLGDHSELYRALSIMLSPEIQNAQKRTCRFYINCDVIVEY